MGKWSGKSRGTVLGFRIYVLIIQKLGLRSAYFVLLFVAFYFLFFAATSTKSIYYFFKKRLGHAAPAALWHVYRSYFTFGRIQLDRVAITAGLKERFSFEFDGISHIEKLRSKDRGGILLTAHIGNFNLAKHFFEEKHTHTKIHLVMSDFEHQAIKNYLESVSGKSNLSIIVLKDDLSHIFKMNHALNNNELLVFAADRYMEETKTWKKQFMGASARFPQGPFKLAIRNDIPVLFVHIMRERKFHYHFYARPYIPEKNTPKELLKAYIENLEKMVVSYPHQWYNFYDYWNDFS